MRVKRNRRDLSSQVEALGLWRARKERRDEREKENANISQEEMHTRRARKRTNLSELVDLSGDESLSEQTSISFDDY